MVIKPTLTLGINTDNVARLRELASEVGAFLQGEFTLVSGRESSYYFDGKRLTLSPEGSYRIGKAIVDELAGTDVDAIGGVAVGGYPMVTAAGLVSYLEGKSKPIFIVREVTKEHGTKRRIEGHFKKGSRVALVEDVLTTGGSVLRAVGAVEEAGGRVVRVMVLVDRDEGGSDRLRGAGYELTSLLRVVH
ncbi:MAG: orotate phosphoribosyltransferase [Dehalococcoidales bacterium]|nr:orotate phosphoribosyltransferase [Dehalococcoidales bacterium]